MGEPWREVAHLGRTENGFPRVLADSHGWCLRLGPRKRIDENYYSSTQGLLLGLTEHFLRRSLGSDEEIRTLAKMQDLLLVHLREAAALGAELKRTRTAQTRVRAVPRSHQGTWAPKSPDALPGSGIAAGAAESGSRAA